MTNFQATEGQGAVAYMALRLLSLRALLLTSQRSPSLVPKTAGEAGLNVATSSDSPYATVPAGSEARSSYDVGWCPDPRSAVLGVPVPDLQPSEWVASAFGCQPQLRRLISSDCSSSPSLSPAVSPTGGRSDRLMAVCAGLCRAP